MICNFFSLSMFFALPVYYLSKGFKAHLESLQGSLALLTIQHMQSLFNSNYKTAREPA